MEAQPTPKDPPDSKERFTDRVDAYVRNRPSYPPAVAEFLRRIGLFRDGITVVDVGSGTGISSAYFLRQGAGTVVGVEPNAAMRGAAERMLGDPQPGGGAFVSQNGSAEATGLPDASADLIVAGQAFHWFDRPAAKREFVRVLRPGGGVALFWNTRLLTGSAFAEGYEGLLRDFATDYHRVRHDEITPAAIAEFFAPAAVEAGEFPAEQVFDYAGLEGRLLSSSYAPAAGHPKHAPMLAALRALFDRCQDGGRVVMAYKTEVYAGRQG